MASEDLDGVDRKWFVVDRVSLDDSYGMAVNREDEVWVAREGEEAEAIALALRNRDDGEIGRAATSEATEAINENRVRGPDALLVYCLRNIRWNLREGSTKLGGRVIPVG